MGNHTDPHVSPIHNYVRNTMEFKNLGGGLFGLLVGDDMLQMTREEAEQLFVDIGHILQDDDIERYDESLLSGDQPDG